MKYKVIPIPKFKKEARRLINKFPSLKYELYLFEKELSDNPHVGIGLGNNTYKIRLAIKSKGKGKSGGARIITYLLDKDFEIYLLSIYDKSEMDNVNDYTLRNLIAEIQGKNN